MDSPSQPTYSSPEESHTDALKSPKTPQPLLLIGIIVITLIVLTACSIYFFSTKQPVGNNTPVVTPTPIKTLESMSDWQMITNTLGYTLNYPASMKVLSESFGGDTIVTGQINADSVVISDNPQVSPKSPTIHIKVVPADVWSQTIFKNKSLDDISLMSIAANRSNPNLSIKTDIHQITFDGKKAYSFTIAGGGYESLGTGRTSYGDITVIETEYNGNLYSIAYTDHLTTTQIVSTFKFIKPTQVSPTAISVGDPMATVKGTVTYQGAACNSNSPGYKVPPCDGPYPNYTITFQGSEIVRTVTADQKGSYSINLAPGTYTVTVPNGLSTMKTHQVRVDFGQQVTLNLTVNTGVQ